MCTPGLVQFTGGTPLFENSMVRETDAMLQISSVGDGQECIWARRLPASAAGIGIRVRVPA
jgi:hypothetical protein